MSKKTFYIIIITLAALMIIGGLIWYFILKPEEMAAPISGIDFTAPGQIKNGSNIKVLSKGPVISARLDDYGVLWYYDYSGRLWQLNQDESEPVLTNETPIQNLSDIIWPKVSSPDGKRIVYQKNNGLFTSDLNGKNQRALISDLKIKDIILKWPTANNVAIISKPSGAAIGGLWLLDVRNLGIRKIMDNLGLEALFSPDGSGFIYSYVDQNGKNPILAIYDKKENQKNISNVFTIVDKCVWTKDMVNIYCAVPKLWPDFAVLPDDYYKNAFSTADDIWKINTETSEKTLIIENIGSISNLAVNSDEGRIFFILKENQFLYKLNIK